MERKSIQLDKKTWVSLTQLKLKLDCDFDEVIYLLVKMVHKLNLMPDLKDLKEV